MSRKPNFGLTEEDRQLIFKLRKDMSFSLSQILKQFPDKNWKKTTVHEFLKKIEKIDAYNQVPAKSKYGIRSARTDANIKKVKELFEANANICPRKICKDLDISINSLKAIVKIDLGMGELHLKRERRSKKPLPPDTKPAKTFEIIKKGPSRTSRPEVDFPHLFPMPRPIPLPPEIKVEVESDPESDTDTFPTNSPSKRPTGNKTDLDDYSSFGGMHFLEMFTQPPPPPPTVHDDGGADQQYDSDCSLRKAEEEED